MSEIQLKRVYESPEEKDGYRILVDRLWPRGVKKEDLPYESWPKEMTPSNDLRKWFDHESEKFEAFKDSYIEELLENEETESFVDTVNKKLKDQNVTLLYAAKDEENNHAIILKEFLEEQIKS